MLLVRTRVVFVLAAVGLFAASSATGQERPALDRCQDFCRRVYDEYGDEYEECALACVEADGCHSRCKEKFGADRPRVQRCLRACMRRNDPAPPAPPEEPAKLQPTSWSGRAR